MVSLWLYTGLIAAVALERLFELRLSAKNAQWALLRGGKEYGFSHYRFMTVLHTAFLVACVAEPWLFSRPFSSPWGFVALALVFAAQALRYWAITTLGRRWNTRVIVLPEALPVTSGPYRFVRHPNYVAVVLELLVLPLVHGAWLTATLFTVVNAALLSVRVRVEEAALGARYAASFANTPRLVPSPLKREGQGGG